MKRYLRIILSLILCVLLVTNVAVTVFAHSGRTDSSGGHKDNKNKSGLGSYHYHCGGYPAHLHTGGYCPYRDIFPSRVSVSVGKKNLRMGETTSFSAEVYPANSCNTHVSISCDNTQVIRISGETITAIGYGTAVITCESFNGKVTKVTITVKEVVPERINITTDKEMNPIYIGDAFTCTANLTPADVDNPTVTWESDNFSVAKVDSKGNVTTYAEGTAIITATAANGVSGKIEIKVKEKQVESVELSEEELELLLYDRYALTSTITPSDATFPELSWSTSDETVVEVDKNGKIVAVGCGIATVTATAQNGVHDSVEVEVTEVVAERIEIIGDTNFYVNDCSSLEAKIYPADTSVQEISWATSDPTIVTIDENGKLTCLAEGNATIIVTQKDVSSSVQITVKVKKVDHIEIQSSVTKANELTIDKTMTLIASVYPEDATYQDITWSSSDTTIAVVDENGVVTGIAPGKVVITATTKDGFTEEYNLKVSHSLNSFIRSLFGK